MKILAFLSSLGITVWLVWLSWCIMRACAAIVAIEKLLERKDEPK